MLDTTLHTIQEQGLVAAGQKILIGVSGGADSTALFYLLFALSRSLEIHLEIAHIHHGLRGKEADREAAFVKSLGWKLGLPVHQVNVDTRERADRDKLSIEMAARALRQEAFLALCKSGDFAAVALAHTQDDQAETVLLRLARGTSLQGLGGMDYAVHLKGLRIIRPLLGVARHDLRSFLESHQLSWMEDSSNTSMDFLRNRMRHEVLPLLKTHFNSSAIRHLANVAHDARQVSNYLEAQVESSWGACVIEGQGKRKLLRLVLEAYQLLDPLIQHRLAMRWLRLCGVPDSGLTRNTLSALEKFIEGKSSAWNFPGNVLIEKDHGGLRLRPTVASEGFSLTLALPGAIVVEELGFYIVAKSSHGRSPVYPNRIGTYPQEAYLAQRAFEETLIVRTWEKGDRISPLGMKGRKKVQDVFTDEKVARSERNQIPLICSGDQVLWIPGYAVDRHAGVEDFSEPSWHITLHPVAEYENADKSQ